MQQCEKSLKINIDYQNSLGTNDDIQKKEMDKEIERLINEAHLPSNTFDNHVERLVDFYSKQDEAVKNNFFRNVMTQLIVSKKILNSSPTIGMVTGRDNMKTYTFFTSSPYSCDPILRDLEIKFVRENDKETGNSQYLLDLEPSSPHFNTLMEHTEAEFKLEEINKMPEQFKRKLLSKREYSERS